MCNNTAVWILFGTAGNAVFAPGTIHNVREFMFVQFICSGRVFSLFCTTGFADAVRCLLLNRSVASQVVQLVDHVSAPSFVALAPSQLSEDPSRTYDSHVSTRYTQLISMGSR